MHDVWKFDSKHRNSVDILPSPQCQSLAGNSSVQIGPPGAVPGFSHAIISFSV